MALRLSANSVYKLPDLGNDWLFGLRDMYIILSLKHSTKETPKFWQSGDCGFTEHLVNCGIYSKDQIEGQIWYYNDGISAMAIPLTETALQTIGLKICINFESTDMFLNRLTTATK